VKLNGLRYQVTISLMDDQSSTRAIPLIGRRACNSSRFEVTLGPYSSLLTSPIVPICERVRR
jgi:hypothetical protein